jgi:hypothetical protein
MMIPLIVHSLEPGTEHIFLCGFNVSWTGVYFGIGGIATGMVLNILVSLVDYDMTTSLYNSN